MATFPTLSTGAVSQYPAPLLTSQNVQAIRFLDGTDQRYMTQGRTYRTWEIRLDLLNEAELAQLETFFVQTAGDYASFGFPDPFTGTVVPNCRFANATLITTYSNTDAGSAVVMVMENNG